MTPHRLLNTGIGPALAELEKLGIPDSVEARRFLLAIALQESGLRHRRQVVNGGAENGPAVSWYQFEQGGGCKGVLAHKSTGERMKQICEDFNVTATPQGLWEAMRYNDVVSSAAARLLIYTLPFKLPTKADDGWMQYLSGWRPGRPHASSWRANWDAATSAMGMKA